MPGYGCALVTGARGFIGRHLVRRLLADGVAVHAVTRAAIDGDGDGGSGDGDGVRWWSVDLTDEEATAAVVTRVAPDVVFHLASDVRGSRAARLVLDLLDRNLRAAVTVMCAAARVPGCRVVLAGSVEEPRQEGEHAVSPYAAAKGAATTYASLFDDLYGVSVTVLRLAMVYGPDQPDETKVVPYVATSLLAGDRPRLGSGVREIDWVHVDDVVEAFVVAGRGRDLDGHDLAGAVFDVGSGEGVSIRTVVALVADAVAEVEGTGPGPSWDAGRDREGERVHLADAGPIRTRLGWAPRVGLAEGIRGVVDWYRTRPRAT